MTELAPVVAVVGPTATGKSDARRRTWPQRARRRDHQRRLDAALPRHGHRHRQAAAGRARRRARTTCSTSGRSPSRRRWPSTRRWPAPPSPTIHGRGRFPILVGGSGLYLRGALDAAGVPGRVAADPGPPVRRTRRASARRRCTRRLAARRPGCRGGDPAQQRPADRARPRGHRADRAAVRRTDAGVRDASTTASQIGLDRDDLDERVELRVHAMMAAGFLDEVARLLPAGPAREPDGGQGARLRPTAGLPRRRRRRRRRPGRGRRSRPSGRRGGSSGGSDPGSGATRGCAGSTRRPELPDLAVAPVPAACPRGAR